MQIGFSPNYTGICRFAGLKKIKSFLIKWQTGDGKQGNLYYAKSIKMAIKNKSAAITMAMTRLC